MAITPWSRWGIGAFVTGIWAGLIVGVLASLPIAIGLRRRPRWWRRWVVGSFGLLIVGWLVTLAVGLLYPLGLVPLRLGPLGSLASVGWTGLVFLVVLALPAWWLLRTLRDPGWRGGVDRTTTRVRGRLRTAPTLTRHPSLLTPPLPNTPARDRAALLVRSSATGPPDDSGAGGDAPGSLGCACS